MPGFLFSLGAAGLGAGLMYFFDPDRGRRRRRLAQDGIAHSGRHSRREFERATRDLANRAQGVAAFTASALRREPPDDDLLARRVRSRIGRATVHPAAVKVEATGGLIRLSGPAFSSEADALLAAARATPGVEAVENDLELHDAPEVPALRNPGRVRSRNSQRRWKPADRLLGGLAAAGLVGYGMQRGGFLGGVAKLAGAGLIVRSISNYTLGGLVGLDGRCDVDIQKTVTLNAPIETVYRFWSNHANFPRFMSHLTKVEDLGGDRSRWVAEGLAGVPVEWSARTTRREENAYLAWESEPGSTIVNRGAVRFEPQGDDRTRVSLRMTYQPPAGLLGHTVASILGVDPKHQIDEDMVRMKSLIETGRTRAHHHAVTREEIENPAGPGEA